MHLYSFVGDGLFKEGNSVNTVGTVVSGLMHTYAASFLLAKTSVL